jgi:hypothetical protein
MISKKTITFLSVILFGVMIAGIGYADMTGKTSITEQEETVNGKVTNITIEPAPLSDESFGISDTVMSYQPVIQYNYSYSDETYTDEERLMSKRGNMTMIREEVEEDYKEGEMVSVYIKEGDPYRSSLEESGDYTNRVLILVGSIIALFTIVLANRSRKF